MDGQKEHHVVREYTVHIYNTATLFLITQKVKLNSDLKMFSSLILQGNLIVIYQPTRNAYYIQYMQSFEESTLVKQVLFKGTVGYLYTPKTNTCTQEKCTRSIPKLYCLFHNGVGNETGRFTYKHKFTSAALQRRYMISINHRLNNGSTWLPPDLWSWIRGLTCWAAGA